VIDKTILTTTPLHGAGGHKVHEGRTRKGDPVGRPDRVGEKPFLRVARGRFYVTTRINSEKWEKGAGKGA
jgi:hypothetical protein